MTTKPVTHSCFGSDDPKWKKHLTVKHQWVKNVETMLDSIKTNYAVTDFSQLTKDDCWNIAQFLERKNKDIYDVAMSPSPSLFFDCTPVELFKVFQNLPFRYLQEDPIAFATMYIEVALKSMYDEFYTEKQNFIPLSHIYSFTHTILFPKYKKDLVKCEWDTTIKDSIAIVDNHLSVLSQEQKFVLYDLARNHLFYDSSYTIDNFIDMTLAATK